MIAAAQVPATPSLPRAHRRCSRHSMFRKMMISPWTVLNALRASSSFRTRMGLLGFFYDFLNTSASFFGDKVTNLPNCSSQAFPIWMVVPNTCCVQFHCGWCGDHVLAWLRMDVVFKHANTAEEQGHGRCSFRLEDRKSGLCIWQFSVFVKRLIDLIWFWHKWWSVIFWSKFKKSSVGWWTAAHKLPDPGH